MDDVCVINKVKTKDVLRPDGPDRVAVDRALVDYATFRAEVSVSKGFGFARPLKEGELPHADADFVTWGSEVKGTVGLCGSRMERRQWLAIISFKALHIKFYTREFLDKWDGLFVHPFGHRKECSSVLHRWYKWKNTIGPLDRVKMPADIKDEITMAALLLPLAVAHLKWPISNIVTATDATPTTGASIQACVTNDLAGAMYSATEFVGQHVCLEVPGVIPQESKIAPPLEEVENVVAATPWSVKTSRKFKDTTHVNLRELEEICSECRSMVSLSPHPELRVNGSDSMVSIGAWAKARSSSLLINGKLRKTMCWCVFGRKQLSNYHLTSKGNPSDDPTRDVPLRKPVRAEKWLKPLLREEAMLCCDFSLLPMDRKWGREIYAGKAGLTLACRKQYINMLRPLEAYGPSGYNIQYDIDDTICQRLLERDVRSGLVWYLHWGIDCKSWGRMNTFNGGTRSAEHPDGGAPPLDRELLGNRQAEFMCHICTLLHGVGGIFTIENPFPSFLWKAKSLIKLYKDVSCFVGQLDQCMYGLKLPGSAPYTFCEKRTQILSNAEGVRNLSRKCNGQHVHHIHEHAFGARRVAGKSVSLTHSAGVYPIRLCDAWSGWLAGERDSRR